MIVSSVQLHCARKAAQIAYNSASSPLKKPLLLQQSSAAQQGCSPAQK